MKKDALSDGLSLELKRGTLVLSVLSVLKEKAYGYALVEKLQSLGIETEGNTLYPLLRRLEKQGLLSSEWSTEETKPRKYYSTTVLGEEVLLKLNQEWNKLVATMHSIVRGDDDETRR